MAVLERPEMAPATARPQRRLVRWLPVALTLLFIIGPLLAYRKGAPAWVLAVPPIVVGAWLVRLYRRSGLRLFGPHLFYDPGRLARRGRVTGLRIAFLATLLFGLGWTYGAHPPVLQISNMSQITQRYTFAFFVLQNLTIVLLTPVYVGSAIGEEREHRSLELLFTTPLRSWEIVLGILGGRLLLMSSFTLAAVPILCLLQLWGGVDMPLMLGNELNSVLLLIAVGCVCMLASALAPTVIWGVVGSYGLLLVPFFVCGGLAATDLGSPFVLFDARTGTGAYLTVQRSLPILAFCYAAISAAALALAILALRTEHRRLVDTANVVNPRLVKGPPARDPALPRRLPAEENPDLGERIFPGYVLPPVGDDALRWKECHTGGRPLIFSPFASSFLVLFLLYGVPVFVTEHRFEQRVEVLQFYYYAFLVFYAVGAMFRATASVAREREQQTLDMLLQIPEDRRTILRAKWYGVLWKGWPWLVLVAGNVLGGLVLGYYSPLQAAWLLVAPWPLLLLLTGLAGLLSVALASVLRARLTVAVLLLGIVTCLLRARVNPIPAMPPLPVFAGDFWWRPGNERDPHFWLFVAAGAGAWQLAYLVVALGLHLAAVRAFGRQHRSREARPH